MKKMLALGALVLGFAFAGETIANAQCYYPAPAATAYYAPRYGYNHHRHVVRRVYVRPTYYGHYGNRPYNYQPRVAIGVGF